MRWNPWVSLRHRPHVLFALVDLPAATGGAVAYRDASGDVILLDPALPPSARTVALAHELVHLERDGPGDLPAAGPLAVMRRREDRRVDEIVARRLVPPDDLRRFVREQPGPVTVADIADAFEVTSEVAQRAAEALR